MPKKSQINEYSDKYNNSSLSVVPILQMNTKLQVFVIWFPSKVICMLKWQPVCADNLIAHISVVILGVHLS